MASKSAQFFENGTNKQFEFVFSKYQEALQAKADSKNSKSEILIKLDKWYQNELPKKIKSRGKEAHLTHEEIVQTIKWKLAVSILVYSKHASKFCYFIILYIFTMNFIPNREVSSGHV